MKNIIQKKIKLVLIIVMLPLLNFAQTIDASKYKMPNIEFDTKFTLGYVTSNLQLEIAKKILASLFYMALCIGSINVVRVFVFYPDKAKKVATNFLIGILAYSILLNFIG